MRFMVVANISCDVEFRFEKCRNVAGSAFFLPACARKMSETSGLLLDELFENELDALSIKVNRRDYDL